MDIRKLNIQLNDGMMNMVNRIVRIGVILYLNTILSGCRANIWLQEPHFYTVNLETHTWNEAREYCRLLNDQLIRIANETESYFWTKLLNLTRLQDHRSADGVYWTGLHAPDTNSSLSLFWDDCSVSTNVGITNNGSTANGYQCVAMYSRDVSYVELHRSMCNETYPFICSTNWNGSDCVKSCDELVVLTDQDVCDKLCDNIACYTIYLNQMNMCHVVPKVYTSSTIFTICYLPSEDFAPEICGHKTENLSLDKVDTSPTVTDITCTLQQPNITVTNTTNVKPCECLCEKLWTFLPNPLPETENLTIEEKIEIIVNELSLDKKNTSSSLRKYVSVMDYRPSSIGIGIVAGAIIMAVIGTIIIMDLSTIWSQIHSFFLSLLQMLSIPNSRRCGIQPDLVRGNEGSMSASNDQITDKVNSVGWFSRERLLYTSSDAEDTYIELALPKDKYKNKVVHTTATSGL